MSKKVKNIRRSFNRQELHDYIFVNNPLFEKVKEKYPDRDYEYQFELMVDWWEGNKGRLPVNVSAFSNWLKFTEPDPEIRAKRLKALQQEDDHKRDEERRNTPQAKPETLAKLRENISKLKKKF